MEKGAHKLDQREEWQHPSYLYGDHFGGNAEIVQRQGGNRTSPDALFFVEANKQTNGKLVSFLQIYYMDELVGYLRGLCAFAARAAAAGAAQRDNGSRWAHCGLCRAGPAWKKG